MTNQESEHEVPDSLDSKQSRQTDQSELEVVEHGEETDQALEQDFQADVDAGSQKTSDRRVLEAEKEALLARAEMENFRKRMQRDFDQQIKYANLPLMKDLLEVWDNLQRAIEAADGDEPATKALRDGVSMVSQQMTDVLNKFGCKRIDSLGLPFDPNVHEAISQMPSDEYEAGKVMHEAAVGYLLHDRVVRPSHVVVSRGANPNE